MKKATSERLLLLDLNVLLALAWPNHQFHTAATERLTRHEGPWATCALTQLGFIRLSANPSVVGVTKSPADAAALLERLVQDTGHQYLDSLPSPVAAGFEHILGSQQVTDVYLLWLAQHHDAKLDRKSTRLNSSHIQKSRMPSSA